jgi:hypothetical protein
MAHSHALCNRTLGRIHEIRRMRITSEWLHFAVTEERKASPGAV